MNDKVFKVLSWGGGTQSTALGEMSASGEIERLDAIIFADTGFERQKTYEIVGFYSQRWREMGTHVEIVSAGNIRQIGMYAHIHIPFFTSDGAPLTRQCTSYFKINPIKRRVRELMGFDPSKPPHPKPGAVEQWIGFSWDEWHRMKDSKTKFVKKRYPLIEMRLSRWDNISYLKRKDLPIPIQSACICCPYRSSSEWLKMKLEAHRDFSEAISFDNQNRHNPLVSDNSTSDQLFIYRHSQPLATADLEADAERERKDTQIPLLVCNGAQCWT